MYARWTILAALALALAIPASAPARQIAPPKAPTGLKAFLLRYSEPTSRSFSRTPSFGWKPVKRALSYEFELATASSFRDNSIVWDSGQDVLPLKVPDYAVPIALPWITGNPYSFFARVRANTQNGTTAWSSSFGFNVRWTQIPAQLSAPNGLLRWTPVDGATSYEVWEINIRNRALSPSNPDFFVANKLHYVATNVTDMRDWFTFHQSSQWVGTADWRVRAVRVTYGTSANGETTTTYGPWSPVFHTHATPPSVSKLNLGSTVSNKIGTVARPVAHALMPGFSWRGSVVGGAAFELYRVYIFSDRSCIDPVFTGSIVGSPAWVPRLSGPIALPSSDADIASARTQVLADGNQTHTFDSAYNELTPNETSSSDSSGGGSTTLARLDLWDREWPSGAYYWTVVPVVYGENSYSSQFEYRDAQVPQDACATGRVGTFGRVSQPIPAGNKTSYVIGLSKAGRLTSQSANRSPHVYGRPLVTWSPALGADAYEIQVSQTRYPFKNLYAPTPLTTQATSATLWLPPGSWYYRVRGLNSQLPAGAQGMVWSSVRRVIIVKPRFVVVK
ncbi:MAG: hypothetical protein ABSC51_04155 [Gaiellaceae bacterium]|jgi:hypothetical protein